MPKEVTLSNGETVKPASKTGETILSILSTLGNIGGNLIFGRDIGLGDPFALGAQFMKNKRESKNLMELLSSNPHTSPIVDMVAQASDASGGQGLINHPEVQNALGIPSTTSQDAPGSTQTSQVGVGPQSPQPIAPGASQTDLLSAIRGQNQPIDYQSPAFLEKMAVLEPDMAKQVLLSKASTKPTSLADTIGLLLKGKALEDYQTPEEKKQGTADAEMTKFNYEQHYKNIDQKAKMGTEDIKSLEANETALGHVQSMPQTLPSNFPVAANLFKHGGQPGKVAASFIYPDVARVFEGLQATKIYFASSLKNSRVNPKLLDTLEQSFPDPTLNPGTWPVMMKQVAARLRFADLVKKSELTEAHKTKEGIAPEHGGTTYMTPEDSQQFQSWLTMFNKYGAKALESPTFSTLTDKFDLQDLMITLKK